MADAVRGLRPERFAGRVIVDPGLLDRFDEAMFEPDYWHSRRRVVGTAGGRGQVLFLDEGGEQWVLRHYHRGGWASVPLGDRYLWTGADRTRSLAEFRLLGKLYGEGLPVPRPVAARYSRAGAIYRADLITARIPNASSVAAIVTERLPADSAWRDIGACIRRLHDAGVYHADLNAHNILLSEDGQVHIIDFDRGRRRGGSRWKKSNLKRLLRSLHKTGVSLTTPEFEKRQWPALLAGYDGVPVVQV